MDKKLLWTVEFSESQQCFNVNTLDAVLEGNLRIFFHPNNCNDWSLLAIFESHKDAHALANRLRKERGIKNVLERFAEEHCE